MPHDPAFLFYSQDFIVGVQTMNFEDRGKFITILAQMHQQGRLLEETIRFMVGEVSKTLKSKFLVDDEGKWYNVRLESEVSKRTSFVDSRRENGRKGGRPSKPKGKTSCKAIMTLLEDENEDVNNKYLIFEVFRMMYKGKKRNGYTEFENFIKNTKDWEKVLPLLKPALKAQIEHREKILIQRKWVPEWKHIKTWINNRCWEEEPEQIPEGEEML